jgi:hypothetical protein
VQQSTRLRRASSCTLEAHDHNSFQARWGTTNCNAIFLSNRLDFLNGGGNKPLCLICDWVISPHFVPLGCLYDKRTLAQPSQPTAFSLNNLRRPVLKAILLGLLTTSLLIPAISYQNPGFHALREARQVDIARLSQLDCQIRVFGRP